MIEFLVQVPNLQLSLQIDLVIVLRSQPIARFRPVLTHHDDRRLHGSETGENQVEENEWIRIECTCREDNAVKDNPDEHTAPNVMRNFQLPPNSAMWSESRSPNVSFRSNCLLMSLERISCRSKLSTTSWSSSVSSPISSSKTSLT